MSSGKESEAGEAAPPSGTEGVLDLSALLGSGDIDIDPEALAGLFGGASFGLDGPVPAAAATEESKSNIWIAASDGDAEKVFSFIDSGVSVNAQDEHGYSTLHAVVGYGHTQLLHRLLAAGADVTLRDSEGDTPLHVCEHTECALVLLEAGADVQAKNDAGQTALDVVEADGDLPDMVELLRRKMGRSPPTTEADAGANADASADADAGADASGDADVVGADAAADTAGAAGGGGGGSGGFDGEGNAIEATTSEDVPASEDGTGEDAPGDGNNTTSTSEPSPEADETAAA